jgi:hypothetical protein
MRKPQLLLASAWLIHVVAWCVQVIKGVVTLPNGLPGWEAFTVAACAALPCRDTHYEYWYIAVLAGLSALNTILFILGSPWVIWRGSPFLRRASGWIAAVSFALNTHWFILFGKDRYDLRAGYYLWLLSFLVLSLGFFDLARESKPAPLTKSHAA